MNTLKKEAQCIVESGEKIDLFVITHTDRDHIGGVLALIRDFELGDIVDKFWFNYEDLTVEVDDRSGKISIADGIHLRDYLKQNGKLPAYDITAAVEAVDFYGAWLTVLSPMPLDVGKYQNLWLKEEKAGLERTLITAGEDDYSHSISELSQKPFREDRSLLNRVSIAFLFQLYGKSILFLADSHPSIVVNSLKRLGYSRDRKLKVDLVKLSHHGSKFNTSDELLSLIQCDSFAISANGQNRDYFPHKECLARILCSSGRDLTNKVQFIFNYDNDTLRSIFSVEEFEKYNFECLYPDIGENGYTIGL
ncbi:MAG: MBL fold metallo-hydrolase [Anaerolineae bacterium]|nr:MBL fold metallo-hydrolase [Anaerolineae bacterium]